MNFLQQDIRATFRLIRKRPGLTSIILISLALGIGANTLMFSVIDAVLLRSLPYADAGRLVAVWFTPPHQPEQTLGTNSFGYFELRDRNQVFESIGAARLTSAFNVEEDSPSASGREHVDAQWFTAGMIQTLGVNPLMGRWPDPNNPKDDGIVIGYGLWQRLFGGSRDVLGKRLRFDNFTATIRGVLPPGFELLHPAQLWIFQSDANLRGALHSPNRIFTVFARLKPGATVAQAQANMNLMASNLAEGMPDMNRGWGIQVQTLRDAYAGSAKKPLLVFQGAVFFVLLIACANAAGLLLAQASSQQKELAMRAALGCSRGRIVRGLLIQSTVLSILAGALGTALAAFGLPVFMRLGFPGGGNVALNSGVLVFTLLVSLATGLAFGALPALQVSRPDLMEVLRESTRGGTASGARQRLRSGFVVAQISLALVLLVGAGLMINTFLRLSGMPAGFNPRQLVTFRIPFSRTFYADSGRTPAGSPAVDLNPRLHVLSESMRERLEAVPGVQSAAYAVTPPLGGDPPRLTFTVVGRVTAAAEQEALSAEWYPIGPRYFQTLQLPLLRGREFSTQDSASGTPVAIVDAALAQQLWPQEDALGKKLQMNVLNDPPREIVGVVGDLRQNRYQVSAQPQIYVPRVQLPPQGDMTLTQQIMVTTFVVRANRDAALLTPLLRQAVTEVDPSQAVTSVRTVEQYASGQLDSIRQYVTLLSAFGGISLALAVIGIFGVMSHAVSQRINEIGIRMALGASSGEVLGIVMQSGLRLVGIGVLLGLTASLLLTRLIKGLLWGVTATDPVTYIVVAAALSAVALLACYLPARRAVKVDPMVALRYE